MCGSSPDPDAVRGVRRHVDRVHAILSGNLVAAFFDKGEQVRAVGGEVGSAGGHRVVPVAGR